MDALDDLAELAGMDRAELRFLDDLAPADAARLTGLYAQARVRHDEMIQAAVGDSLKIVPAPLRGPVKKLLRSGRR